MVYDKIKILMEKEFMLKDLLLKSRSYRRFYENEHIDEGTLKELVDLTRLTPSTVNSQPLRFRIVSSPEENAKVFECLSWAGLLKDWDGPDEGERPSAYIVILCDLSVGKDKRFDDGIAAQTIMLGAAELGLGGCIFGSVKRDKLAESLSVDTEKYSIDLVLALGKTKENVIIVDIPESGSTAYFRDENGVHYVPKHSVDTLIV